MVKHKIPKILSLMLALVFAVNVMMPSGADNIFGITVYADTGSSGQDNRNNEGKKDLSQDVDYWNDTNMDSSFAWQIRMATNYANRMANDDVPLGGENNEYSDKIDMNEIGVFFGYTSGEVDTDTLNSPELTRGGSNSLSSVNYSRNLLWSYKDGQGEKAGQYGDYGLLLYLMGFDSTGTAAIDAQRKVLGLIALASYYAASSVNTLFELMFNVLESLNPFQFFQDATFVSDTANTEIDKIAANAQAAADAERDGLTKLTEFFGQVFDVFTDFAWSVSIPLSLIFIIVTFFLTRRGKYSIGGNIKKFAIRVVFVAIGIPILGSAYTQVLTGLEDVQAEADDYLVQAVSYTFLDFSKWVESTRLDPATGDYADSFIIGYNSGNAFVTASTWFNLRQTCNSLNFENGVFGINNSSVINSYLGVDEETGALLKDYIYDTSDTAPTLSIDSDGSKTIDKDDYRQAALELIRTYMDGTKYTAEEFETGSISYLIPNGSSSGTAISGYVDYMLLSSDKYSFSQNAERQVHGLTTAINGYYDPAEPENAAPYSKVAVARFDTGLGSYTLWCNGGMTASTITTSTATTSSSGIPIQGYTVYSGTGVHSGANSKGGLDYSKTTGLSTMAMYTYLTTSFSQTGLTVYGDAPSTYTQTSHYAVNLIGGNYIMQFAFFCNTIAILAGYFVLALLFVFRTAFDVLFRGIQLLGHALFAAIGLYKSIGTCICMTISMMVQLFVSVIFFSFVADLMFIASDVVNHFLRQLFTAIGLTVTGTSGLSASASEAYQAELIVMVSSYMVALVIVFFVSFAAKWRSVVVSSLNSTVESAVGTLLGVSLTGASDGGMGSVASAALSDTLGVAKGAAAIGAVGGTLDAMPDTNGATDLNSTTDEDGNPIVDARGYQNDNLSGTEADMNAIAAQNAAEEAEAEDVFNNGLNDNLYEAGDSAWTADVFGNQNLMDKNAQAATNNEGGIDSSASSSSADNTFNTADETSGPENEPDASAVPTTDGTLERADIENNNETTDNNTNSTDSSTTTEFENTETATEEDEAESESESDSSESDSDLDFDLKEHGDTIIGDGMHFGGYLNKNRAKTSEAEETTDESTSSKGEESESSDSVESSVEETSDGTIWSQTNDETGTTTSAKFDSDRGLVLETENEDGTVSDIAIGADGFSIASTDADGNQTVTSIGEDGVTSTYTGVDGTTETVTVTNDGLDSTVTSTRTDANGNSETTVSDINGNVISKSETSADGSTKTIAADDSGNTIIDESNAATGYTSTETIDSTGASTKTESVNGTTTVTKTDSSGDMQYQSKTGTDANGNAIKSEYRQLSNGAISETVTANGVTEQTITDANGDSATVRTSMLADGRQVETVTNNATGETETTIKSATGATLGTSISTSGTDDMGTYTGSVVTTSEGTTEVRDYGNGVTVTQDTDSAGNVSVITAQNGGYNIAETFADGATSSVTIGANGKGSATYTSAEGKVTTESIKADSTGTTSYSTATGGNIVIGSIGSGSSAENFTSASYVTGGSLSTSTNASTGSYATTFVDGIGSSGVINYDASTGSVTTKYVYADTSSSTATTGADGSYTQNVVYVGGGTQSIERTGSGSNRTETIYVQNAAGGTTYTESVGGQVQYANTTGIDGTAISMQRQADGSVVTNETLVSGGSVNTVRYTNGDYMSQTTNANGTTSYIQSENGVISTGDMSLTGIETTSLKSGSATSTTTAYSGLKYTTTSNSETGAASQSFSTSGGQRVVVSNDGSDEDKFSVELSDGTYAYNKTNANGEATAYVSNANGSSVMSMTDTSGNINVVYTDSAGNNVSQLSGADTYTTAFAGAMSNYTSSNSSMTISASSGSSSSKKTSFLEKMLDKIIGSLDTDSSVGMGIADASSDLGEGISDSDVADAMMMIHDMGYGAAYGAYDTWKGGSATMNDL